MTTPRCPKCKTPELRRRKREKGGLPSPLRCPDCEGIWVALGESTDKGDYLEVYTLVGTRLRSTAQGSDRQIVNVNADRYALATREWSSTQTTPIHLASPRHFGWHWRY